MSELVIVGFSGLAREVLTVERTSGAHDRFVVLDDDRATWGCRLPGARVVGGLDEIEHHQDSEVVVCVGAGTARRQIVRRLVQLGVDESRFARVVHPGVDVPQGCSVGVGSVLLAQVVLTSGVWVGRHAVLMPNSTVTHDGVVGDFATLCAGVSLGGAVAVGPTAYLGMNASVRQRTSIGAGATVGMGAVVVEDVPPGEVWAGVPARPLPRPVTILGEAL